MEKVSFVRSISMDHWSHPEILSMLEGGNRQLDRFFDRHLLPKDRNTYRTKAAKFYREQLSMHVDKISRGEYRGRDASRNLSRSPKRKGKIRKSPESVTLDKIHTTSKKADDILSSEGSTVVTDDSGER